MALLRYIFGSLREGWKLLTLERPIWSWIVVATGISRAVSYLTRPPENPSPASQRIEASFTYDNWAILLITYATMITVGLVLRRPSIAWAGHLLGLGVTAILALSILGSATLDKNGWSALGPLIVVGLVHWGRSMALGERVVIKSEQKRSERGE